MLMVWTGSRDRGLGCISYEDLFRSSFIRVLVGRRRPSLSNSFLGRMFILYTNFVLGVAVECIGIQIQHITFNKPLFCLNHNLQFPINELCKHCPRYIIKMLKKSAVKQNPCYQVKVVDCGQNQFIILNDQVIGQGASAIVKRALNKTTNQQYAVKIIRVTNKDSRDIALKQLQIALQLQPNPNLLRIQKIRVQSANNIYIFMQFCNGGTLIDQMKSKHRLFSQAEIYTIFCHLVNGYRVLYEAKVLHEDIKPENVLVKDGVYKIADFGLAIFSENYKYTSKRRGTLYYMAFEKITRKEYTANVKSDIYSMGVMLFEVITGRHPYIDKRGLEIKEFAKELKDARLRHENITQRYSFKFATFFEMIQRMVAKSQEKRISWEEVYSFYQSFEPLEPFKQIKPTQPLNASPFKNALYKEVGRSQATILGLQLEVEERELCESVSEKMPNVNPAQLLDKQHTQQLRLQLTDRRNYAYYLSRVIKSIQQYLGTKRNQEMETLLLALYLYRPRILMFLEDYDPFESIQAAKELIEIYESDSKFVKQQQILHIGQSQLPQLTKKDLISKFKGPFAQLQPLLLDLIRSILCSFLVLRINHRKELILFLYLLTFQKILNKSLPKTQPQFDKIFSLQQGPVKDLSKTVQDMTLQMMVIYDPEREQEESEEFEVLDWEEYVKAEGK